MRITGGTYRGRILESPKDDKIRPTTDKNRQAIFNVLMHSEYSIADAKTLDMFCGTGAMGLEALSRGVGTVTFLDKNPDLAKRNAHNIGVMAVCSFLKQDALSLKPKVQYDLIFIDPPYRQDLAAKALTHLHTGNMLAERCVVVVETEKKAPLPCFDGLKVFQDKAYGDSQIRFMVYKTSGTK